MIESLAKIKPLPSWRELKKIHQDLFEENDVQRMIALSKMFSLHTHISSILVLSTLWRGRTRNDNEVHSNIKDMLWPHKKSVGSGRANKKRQKILYLANSQLCALTETFRTESFEPKSAQLLSVKQKKEINIHVFPIGDIFNFSRTKSSIISHPELNFALAGLFEKLKEKSEDELAKMCFIDASLLDIMRSEDTKLSAELCDLIRRKFPLENVVICYKSVRHAGGICYAISPKIFLKCFDITGSWLLENCLDPSYGIWRTNVTKIATDMKENGDWIWSENTPDILPHFSPKNVTSRLN